MREKRGTTLNIQITQVFSWGKYGCQAYTVDRNTSAMSHLGVGQIGTMTDKKRYLCRGANVAMHRRNEGLLKPKSGSPFSYTFHG